MRCKEYENWNSKEIKNNENRVGLSPSGVHALVEAGHEVLVETAAGEGSYFEDMDYVQAGANIVNSQDDVWNVDMVIKVKEPLKEEYEYFREGLILFTYLHLANEPELTKALIDKKLWLSHMKRYNLVIVRYLYSHQ